MLHEFMENELPTNREETLFHALARDEDLRFEMKYLLSLRSAVQEDDEAGVVPLATTQSLFSRLGYAAAIPASESLGGAVGAAGAASAGAGSGFGTILRGWGSHLLAGLVGMLLAGSFFVIGGPAEGSVENAFAGNRQSGTGSSNAAEASGNGRDLLAGTSVAADGDRIAGTATAATGNAAAATANASPTPVRLAPQRTRRGTESGRLTSPATSVGGNRPDGLNGLRAGNGRVDGVQAEGNDSGIDASTPSGNVAALAEQTEHRSPNSEVDILPSAAAAERLTAPDEFLAEGPTAQVAERTIRMPEPEYETYGQFNFTARGSMVPVNLTTSKLGLDMDRNSGLDRNFALGIEYVALPDLAVGIEVGVDSYLMYFREERANGIINEYEAISSPLWVNATARWTPLEVGPFPLFVQGSIGGSWSGATARLMLGGEFNLEESVTLVGGAELSTIGYQYQNELLLSPRFGLTGGIRLNNLFQTK